MITVIWWSNNLLKLMGICKGTSGQDMTTVIVKTWLIFHVIPKAKISLFISKWSFIISRNSKNKSFLMMVHCMFKKWEQVYNNLIWYYTFA